MATDAQKQIRDNALELQDFLKDLNSWENSIKHKDQQVKSQSVQDKPVRGQSKNALQSHVQSQQQAPPTKAVRVSVVDSTRKESSTVQKKQSPTAANHTYDFFRDKWDKFDVETALRQVDEEDATVHNEGAKENSSPITSGLLSTHTAESQRRNSESQIFGDTSSFRTERLSDALGLKDSGPDSMSEKDAGNQFYKEKKYVKAIESYSRSIALQPTAVAYANRAMAFLKIRRFQDAETDATEAISLDDRYTKAYSRRGTARQELNQYLAAVEDFEFALRLEPENRELQKQYKEAKEVYEKESGIKASTERVNIPLVRLGNDVGTPRLDVSEESLNQDVKLMRPVKSTQALPEKKPAQTAGRKSSSTPGHLVATKRDVLLKEDEVKPVRSTKQAIAATQAAAARAAAVAMAGVARSFVAPRTSYEFEALWKSLSGDRSSQARLLKMIDPSSLPSLFKDSLEASLMMEIIEILDLFFPQDARFAVEVLEHLTKVGRFSMSIMFLRAKEKEVLLQLWTGAFKRQGIPDALSQRLDLLRGSYRLQ